MASRNNFTESDVPDQSGKCFVVTGANTGIGFEISRVLAERGARVIMACRTKDKADAAMTALEKTVPTANLAYLPYDQGDLESIRAAVAVLWKESRIDVLINNAGVMTSRLMRTQQNFELQFGVNHLGCFALTLLLMPKLAETDGARIVVTSSNTHRNAKIDWDDLNAEKSYVGSKRYAASKLANALFFFELDRRLRSARSSVIAVGCHPGAATTEITRNHRMIQLCMPLLRLFLNTPAMGSWPALQAATGEVMPGGYYGPTGLGGLRGASGEASLAFRAQDRFVSRRLWDVSVAKTGIDLSLTSSE